MEFLLESYASTAAAAESGAAQIRASATRSRDAGVPVHVVRSIFVPEDETNLVLFDAPSADDVRTTIQGAGLPVDRLVVAVETPGDGR